MTVLAYWAMKNYYNSAENIFILTHFRLWISILFEEIEIEFSTGSNIHGITMDLWLWVFVVWDATHQLVSIEIVYIGKASQWSSTRKIIHIQDIAWMRNCASFSFVPLNYLKLRAFSVHSIRKQKFHIECAISFPQSLEFIQ